jgi:hypothetical protein
MAYRYGGEARKRVKENKIPNTQFPIPRPRFHAYTEFSEKESLGPGDNIDERNEKLSAFDSLYRIFPSGMPILLFCLPGRSQVSTSQSLVCFSRLRGAMDAYQMQSL